MDIRHYETLASIFYFPGTDYARTVDACLEMLREQYPDVAGQFQPFAEFIRDTPFAELEKLYIRTFDVQALCCLDVGYVLFGEDYTRGKLLANLNKEHHQAGIDCRGELADRLPNILRLMPRLEDPELLEELVGYVLKPALDKMIDEFVPARIREKDEIYEEFHQVVLTKREDHVTKFRIPLQCVREILETDFPELEKVEPATDRDFMESVKNEMKNARKGNKF